MNSDVHEPKTRSYNMSRIRGKNTKPEMKLRSLLHRAGYRFRVNDRNLPGSPDIVLPRYKAVVFVHGCFWHRHEGCKYSTMPKTREEFWRQKFSATVKRDRLQEQQLEAEGWDVFIVWECELAKDPDSVLRHLVSRFQDKRS